MADVEALKEHVRRSNALVMSLQEDRVRRSKDLLSSLQEVIAGLFCLVSRTLLSLSQVSFTERI